MFDKKEVAPPVAPVTPEKSQISRSSQDLQVLIHNSSCVCSSAESTENTCHILLNTEAIWVKAKESVQLKLASLLKL